uniref:Pentatricopeptide repeat-containing protein n=1 Tax=Davidia involucrata TaxID=16924 RepID=A0A5B7AWZ3_DAVIN
MAMSRSTTMAKLVGGITQFRMIRVQTLGYNYSTMVQTQMPYQCNASTTAASLEDQDSEAMCQFSGEGGGGVGKHQIGENVSREDKISFLVKTLLDLKDSKEAVYSELDAWVAWEQKFPIGPLKTALITLEKEQQWHRIIQVLKWMLSKGQGTTMGTYGQLIRALDMDHRAEEAHQIWVKKIGSDLHSVPWQLCKLMISVYYRNNMLEELVKLFKGLEAFDRNPPEKSIVQKVADAYEMLGLPEEKERLWEKYIDLFLKTSKGSPEKFRRTQSKKEEKSGKRKHASNSDGLHNDVDGTQTN